MKSAVAIVFALLIAVAPALSTAAVPAPACATTSPACCENCAQCCATSSVPQRGEQVPAPSRSLSQQQIQLLFAAAVVFVAAPASQDFHSASAATVSVRAPSVPLFTRHCSYLV